MRKLLFVALFLVPCVSFAAFNTNLKYGSSGPGVREMQEFLVSQGNCNITPSGNFFALTLKCVKDFQTNQGIIPASGFWGPLTRSKAVSLIDVSASDADEQTQTGAIASPVISQNDTQIKTLTSQITTLSQQVQTQAQQIAVAQNTNKTYNSGMDTTDCVNTISTDTENPLIGTMIRGSNQFYFTSAIKIKVTSNCPIEGKNIVLKVFNSDGSQYNRIPLNITVSGSTKTDSGWTADEVYKIKFASDEIGTYSFQFTFEGGRSSFDLVLKSPFEKPKEVVTN